MIIAEVIFLTVSFMGGTVSVVLVFCDKARCFLLLAHLIRTGKDFFRKPGFVGIFMDFPAWLLLKLAHMSEISR